TAAVVAVLVVDEPAHQAAVVELGRDRIRDRLAPRVRRCVARSERQWTGDELGEQRLEGCAAGTLEHGAELDEAEVAVHRRDSRRPARLALRARDEHGTRIGRGWLDAHAAEELDVRRAARGVAEQVAHAPG